MLLWPHDSHRGLTSVTHYLKSLAGNSNRPEGHTWPAARDRYTKLTNNSFQKTSSILHLRQQEI